MSDLLSPDEGHNKLTDFQKNLDSIKELAFALSEEEAHSRFRQTHREDPFPSIPPALLNTADVCRYVARTGMIYPFRLSSKDLKLATYHFRLEGKVIFWDEKGERQESRLEKHGDTFTLKGNSIAFVTLEPQLRLPDYIALRFNLRVDNVYRGLLLGTGPIIDPGYVGRLSIPLHNLTTNDYVFRFRERLISVEFTKLSPHCAWYSDEVTRKIIHDRRVEGESTAGLKSHYEDEQSFDRLAKLYLPYKPGSDVVDPDQRDVEHHIHEASPHNPVRSSIPKITQEAQHSAEEAKDELERVRSRAQWLGFALLFGVATLLLAVGSFYFDFRSDRAAYSRAGLIPDDLTQLDNEIRAIRSALVAVCDTILLRSDSIMVATQPPLSIPECERLRAPR